MTLIKRLLFISVFVGFSIGSFLVLADEPNLNNPSEKYLFMLVEHFQKEEQKFKEINKRDMSSQDWLNYANKIIPVTISLPPGAKEENKKIRIKSITLAIAYGFYGFGYENNKNIRSIEIKCQIDDPYAPPLAQGESHMEGNKLSMACPGKGTSGEIFNVVLHEMIHNYEGITQEREDLVHAKVRRNLPFLVSQPSQGNWPMPCRLFGEPKLSTPGGPFQ